MIRSGVFGRPAFSLPSTQGDLVKIRILESLACSVNGTHGPGDIVDWKSAKEAKHLISQGIAEAVGKTSTKVEKATANKAVETAATD